MGDGPVGYLYQVVFVDQLGQRAAVVVADGVRRGRTPRDQFGQGGDQVVAASLLELRGQLRSPVRSVCLQRVRKDGIRRSGAKGPDQRLANLLQIVGDGHM